MIFLTVSQTSQSRHGSFMKQVERNAIGIRVALAGRIPHMDNELIESTDEYDVYKVTLGHLYHFKKDCNKGEFRGQKTGTTRMKYTDGVEPRTIPLRLKYRQQS